MSHFLTSNLHSSKLVKKKSLPLFILDYTNLSWSVKKKQKMCNSIHKEEITLRMWLAVGGEKIQMINKGKKTSKEELIEILRHGLKLAKNLQKNLLSSKSLIEI